jgi:hypothetical protein
MKQNAQKRCSLADWGRFEVFCFWEILSPVKYWSRKEGERRATELSSQTKTVVVISAMHFWLGTTEPGLGLSGHSNGTLYTVLIKIFADAQPWTKKTATSDKVSLSTRCSHWVRTTHEYFYCVGPYDCTIRKFVLSYFGRTIFFLDG